MKTVLSFAHRHLALAILCTLSFTLYNCGGSNTEEVEIPTQGLITTVVEIEPEQYKIEDEQTIPDTSQSLIIAKYLDGGIDTFTLAEARLVTESGYTGARSGLFTAAGYGLFGYMLGRSMTSFRPGASAYVDPQTHSRVNNTAGNSVRSSAARVSRPSAGSRSGYGSGRSSRSYGG